VIHTISYIPESKIDALQTELRLALRYESTFSSFVYLLKVSLLGLLRPRVCFSVRI